MHAWLFTFSAASLLYNKIPSGILQVSVIFANLLGYFVAFRRREKCMIYDLVWSFSIDYIRLNEFIVVISPQYEYILIWLLLFSIYHQISLLLFLADVNSCMYKAVLISNVVQKHFVERKIDSISPFLYGLLCEVAILDAAQFSCDDGHESCSVMNEFFKIVVEIWIVIFTDPFWHTNRNSLKSQFWN